MSMSTVIPETQDEVQVFQQWFFKQTIEFEHDKRALNDEKKKIEMQRNKLERELRDFRRQKEAEERFRLQEERLIVLKQQMLEEELKKLANEKVRVARQKEFYNKVNEYQETKNHTNRVVRGEIFFNGVQSESALKKRYKDLIKIYHPDNQGGDTETLKEINREYDRLCGVFAG